MSRKWLVPLVDRGYHPAFARDKFLMNQKRMLIMSLMRRILPEIISVFILPVRMRGRDATG